MIDCKWVASGPSYRPRRRTTKYIRHWRPGGHVLGWEHGFVHQYADFFEAIAKGTEASPNFDDGWSAQCELDAVEAAAREKRRISL